MDVEFAEYPSLENILEDFPAVVGSSSILGDGDENGGGLPFGQLLVEMHFKNADNPEESKTVIELFKKLEARGLRMFSTEINPVLGGKYFSEFSFINTNDFFIKRFLGN